MATNITDRGLAGSATLRRYRFRARLVFVVVLVVGMVVLDGWMGFPAWVVVPDVLVVAVLVWVAWVEREPLGFLMSWRVSCIAAGLGHKFTVTVAGKDGKTCTKEKRATPQVRRLWYSAHAVCVEVVPVIGEARQLADRAEDLALLLGMSRGLIRDRRSGWRSTRLVLEFRRPAEMKTEAVALPKSRPSLDGGRMVERGGEGQRRGIGELVDRVAGAMLPPALRVEPMPELATAGGDDWMQAWRGFMPGERRLFDVRSDASAVEVRPESEYYHPDEHYRRKPVKLIEAEYRPDLAPSDQPDGVWRRTGFDVVPERCRPVVLHDRQPGGDDGWAVVAPGVPGGGCDHANATELHTMGADWQNLPCRRCPQARNSIGSTSLPTSSPIVGNIDGTDWREFLAAVPVGQRADGSPWTLPLYDTQGLLFVGSAGAGKSGLIWSLNIGLVPALVAGVVELRGLDPKGNELFHGRDYFAEYADDPVDMVEVLEEAIADMRQRKAVLREARARKYIPSVTTPLVVIEIDELMMLLQSKVMTDSKLAKRAESAIVTLLSQGRSFGFMLVGGIQDPRKDSLDMRDLFQVTVALRMPSAMAELVLSKAAVKEGGADTGAIPFGAVGAGVGYVMDVERSGDEAVQVRSFWADDEAISVWEAYLVAARQGTESEGYEAAQMAAERVTASEVTPFPQAQIA